MIKMYKLLRHVLEKENGESFIYTIIYSFGLIVHTFYAIAYGFLGVEPLMIFNCISTAMYLVGATILSKWRFKLILLFMMYVEIVLHCVLNAVLVGWSYGFSMYCMAIIPVCYFVTYMNKKCKRPVILSTALAAANLTIMFITRIYSYSHAPIYSLPVEVSSLVSVINMVLADCVLVVFSVLFMCEIREQTANLKIKNDELDFMANYDTLTHLRNRHSMPQIFEQYALSTNPYCVALGDIDDFKRINDTYGHSAGDKVLRTVSDVISKNIGENGVVCRWGGEEILILVKGNSDSCVDLVEKIRLEIQNLKLTFELKEIHVTMTYGFADYGEAMNVEKLIAIADARLYKGKRNGKNQIVTD